MEIVYLNEQSINNLLPSCVAFGFFDGLHLGHLKLVEEVIKVAKSNNLKKGLLTFDCQPKAYLNNQPFKYLISLDDKVKLLEEYGFDYLFVLRFNHDIAKMEPEKFILEYIIKPNIKHVVCGFDFHFGSHGKGDSKFLRENSNRNYQVTVIDKLEYAHQKISSSYLRELLANGKVELANKLLGRVYRISGKVIHGRQNGRKIGFPTANIDSGDYVLPQNGVYAVKVYYRDEVYLGMANLGYNPTFTALKQVSLEVNIFDFDEDIYDQTIVVEFFKEIRTERKFASVNDLIVQLNHDKKQILNEFA